MQAVECQIPLIGFAAFSGTGKTTLLEKLLPLLVKRNLRVGMVKASHHDIEPDKPGKDSYRLRHAGALQLVLSTPHRSICYTERNPEISRKLSDQLRLLDLERLDLVVVEGFRDEPFPKIELHRPVRNKPLLYPNDANVIAIARDDQGYQPERPMPVLDLNQPEQIADFIFTTILKETSHD
ncbi:molybdopterin-guanine dinucleotide biosynthesis protein B [Endozoicomonas montiporae]|uniref:Molybdopterin-guanine dinucleotide biosynthesis protein B n=2 Tax=Endozoicomonas montiporae TaxID=1027273 RepID=A0A081N751_9GAMM|nr:molybdopterin-guanine dinucleotide biosynthesis protein B [Endozoicomonas montiporae]AMO55908.1 molybdopterin-guanine dinucleotide biosynthesis protein MobB [Endozoicomonas montiporae CL-33]KEQ14274.1 molybdopterin-guanine dinucleotide biosynthesis protein B [Endozoicomonas montiporae]